MPKILVSGSLAYDYLYKFAGDFKNEIISDNKGPLSVAFCVQDKVVHYGGCAGNIVYNGKLLGEDFLLLGIAGHDFDPYEKWLNDNKINTSHVVKEKTEFTSQATIVTDSRGQQITFFHEGASAKSGAHKEEVKKTIKDLASDVKMALISPNNRDFVLASISACNDNKIPFFFDPGQVMPTFSANELIEIINKASGVFLNEYESALLQKLTKMDLQEILRMCPLLIITLGDKGSVIHFGDEVINIPSQKVVDAKDPTGCGDAYRAGFLIGIQKDFPRLTAKILEEAGKMGTKSALACLKAVGTQNHKMI